MNAPPLPLNYVLGLDLGVASVGWAIIKIDPDEIPLELRNLGSRIFEAGVTGGASAMEQGKDEPNALARRTARQMRRQHFRQSQRRGRAFRALQAAGFFPAVKGNSRAARHELLKSIDAQLLAKWCRPGISADQQTWTYRLRAAALEGPLTPLELGRALYQLAHRRGFKSNRKTDPKPEDADGTPDEKAGKKKKTRQQELAENGGSDGEEDPKRMKEQIESLRQKLQARNQTLGQYFATLEPDITLKPDEQAGEQHRRIRGQFTDRKMYEDEFDAIIAAQKPHHPCLQDQAVISSIYKSLFAQRALKSSRHLIGKCPMEDGKHNAIKALPIFQRFRLVQRVNDLEIIDPTGEMHPLNASQREQLLNALEQNGDMSFAKIRDLLGLDPPKKKKDPLSKKESIVYPGHNFTLEAGGEERLPGNRTTSKLRPIIPNWDALPEATQSDIIYTLCSIEHAETIEKIALKKIADGKWGLQPAQAKPLSAIRLEDGRASYSQPALEKLVKYMSEKTTADGRGGVRHLRYAEARKEAYQDRAIPPASESLPPLVETGIDVRNPAVCRVLAETRKVVNAIIARHGKPALIRIETGKDLSKPRKLRKEIWTNNRKRQNEHEKIIRDAKGGAELSRDDREKILLADECGWLCPYSGQSITPHSLVGLEEFAIEHIIPLSRSRDNTFRNKTLCRHDLNQEKANRTPYEAFHNDPRYPAMIANVTRFQGPYKAAKLAAFQMGDKQLSEQYDNFSDRHLADTRFASKVARKFLGLLYADRNADGITPKVQAVAGGMTAHMRRQWELEAVMPNLPNLPKLPPDIRPGEKFRFDHRHHALDAAVIAMTSPRAIQRLAVATREAESHRDFYRPARFPKIEPPLKDCAKVLVDGLARVIVSHREDRRVAGPLHDQTNYSPELGPKKARHQRKALAKLTSTDVKNIVDLRIRAIIEKALGDGEPKKVFASIKSHPSLTAKDGRQIPIHRVRVRVSAKPKKIGKGVRERFTSLKNNHHTVIVQEKSPKGVENWVDYPIERFEVQRRVAEKEPVIKTEWNLGRKPIMWLCKGDTIEMPDENGKKQWYTLSSFSGGDMEFRPHNDARKSKDVKDPKIGDRKNFRLNAEDLYERDAKKVTITPLGEIVYVNDFNL